MRSDVRDLSISSIPAVAATLRQQSLLCLFTQLPSSCADDMVSHKLWIFVQCAMRKKVGQKVWYYRSNPYVLHFRISLTNLFFLPFHLLLRWF